MGRQSGNDGKDGKGGLDLEDFRLWKDFTRDIEPLEEPDWEALEAVAKQTVPQQKNGGEKIVPKEVSGSLPLPATKNSRKQPAQLDLRTELRLRRGQMPIDARLDLHGYNQEQAHGMLNQFVMAAHGSGKRCLLVITGKGRGGLRAAEAYAPDLQPGVLKQKLPQWLSMHPLNDLVLKVFPAATKDGGGGAFYVYLKRQRDYTL